MAAMIQLQDQKQKLMSEEKSFQCSLHVGLVCPVWFRATSVLRHIIMGTLPKQNFQRKNHNQRAERAASKERRLQGGLRGGRTSFKQTQTDGERSLFHLFNMNPKQYRKEQAGTNPLAHHHERSGPQPAGDAPANKYQERNQNPSIKNN